MFMTGLPILVPLFLSPSDVSWPRTNRCHKVRISLLQYNRQTAADIGVVINVNRRWHLRGGLNFHLHFTTLYTIIWKSQAGVSTDIYVEFRFYSAIKGKSFALFAVDRMGHLQNINLTAIHGKFHIEKYTQSYHTHHHVFKTHLSFVRFMQSSNAENLCICVSPRNGHNTPVSWVTSYPRLTWNHSRISPTKLCSL